MYLAIRHQENYSLPIVKIIIEKNVSKVFFAISVYMLEFAIAFLMILKLVVHPTEAQ